MKVIFFILFFPCLVFALPQGLEKNCRKVAKYIIKQSAFYEKYAFKPIPYSSTYHYTLNLLQDFNHLCDPTRYQKIHNNPYTQFLKNMNIELFSPEKLEYLSQREQSPIAPPPLFKIHDMNLPHRVGTAFCYRDLNAIDKITIHHTKTPNFTTVETINKRFKQEGYLTAGYHFLIQSSYETLPSKNSPYIESSVTYGRDTKILGGHNSHKINDPNLSQVSKEDFITHQLFADPYDFTLAENILECFNKKGEKVTAYQYFQEASPNKRKPYLTENMRSIGIGIIGDYYKKDRLLSQEGLNILAKTICTLAQNYPQIKMVDVHQDTQDTYCPGNIDLQLKSLKNKTKKQCPHIKLQFPHIHRKNSY